MFARGTAAFCQNAPDNPDSPMHIKVRSAINALGLAVAAGIALAAGIGAFVFHQVSVGGPLYGQIIQGKDLVADILPPPAYVIEAYLEATLAAKGLKTPAATRERIQTLHKEYDERHRFWLASDLRKDIAAKLTERSHAKVQTLWNAAEQGLLPALERNDEAAAERAYRAISQAYAEHRAIIEEIVADANAMNAGIEADAARQSRTTMIVMGVVLFALLTLLFTGTAAINRWVIQPILRLAGVLTAMSAGHTDVDVPETHRRDEVGTMAAAVLALRDKSIENAEQQALNAERDQQITAERAERERLAAEQKREAERRAAMEREQAAAQLMTEFDAAVGGIVQAAMQGDFSQRVPLDGKDGIIRNLAAALNAMCENVGAVMEDMVAMMAALAEGDLTRRITAQYQGTFATLQDSANTTAERLSTIASDIKSAAVEVANAAAEISTSTNDLSQRTEEQAAGLEQTSASMEEIAATVKLNAENARHANTLTSGARDVAERGGAVVASAVDAMSRIEQSSRKIADIIGIIDEIARQTNLLALNAAVEAARAGDAGRGFAVVASEVRNLAQRSSQAAKDIKDLITNSSSQIKDGVELVNRAGASLTEIVSSIKSVADIVADIATASAEQATGLEQVNKALVQMDEVTQQNSALVEQNAATARTLETQSAGMTRRVEFFRLGDAEATGGTLRSAA